MACYKEDCMPKVSIVMGSKSDFDVVKPCITTLKDWGVEVEVRVLSAHRTPLEAHEYASGAIGRGVEVMIAAAGKAAHLGGVVAAYTTLPVIGIPILTSATAGFDSLLSMVQMPAGVPVATVALNGSQNAAFLALQILGVKYPEIAKKLADYKESMRAGVLAADAEMQELIK